MSARVCFEAGPGVGTATQSAQGNGKQQQQQPGHGEQQQQQQQQGPVHPGGGAAPPMPHGRRAGSKVTVKYNRKELQKRLDLEEWIDERLHLLYDCDEEEMPELEIDIDQLLDMNTDEERAEQLREILQECCSSSEEFVLELLSRIKGMKKLSTNKK
uniref:Protein phosphatase 1 regulatory subunit 14B-like n=2 Tax=Petromyzon marinus TaxID=7757 RepID=A0AAJ7WVG2_PETMA|nr:protein phosphatase 1 regulatory subunit 14B-like [Petromyzon marinus]